MAAMVRWQALSGLCREKYSDPHLRLHPGMEVYHQRRFVVHITLPLRVIRYLPWVRYYDGAKNIESQTSIVPKKSEAPASFEKVLNELEQIVARLESSDLPSEEVLNEFERDVQLTHQGQAKLQQAEQHI